LVDLGGSRTGRRRRLDRHGASVRGRSLDTGCHRLRHEGRGEGSSDLGERSRSGQVGGV